MTQEVENAKFVVIERMIRERRQYFIVKHVITIHLYMWGVVLRNTALLEITNLNSLSKSSFSLLYKRK